MLTKRAPEQAAAVVIPLKERAATWIDGAALLIVLLVIAMRPLVTETYDSSLHSIARVVGGGEAVTPARTAWFGAAIWLATIGATVSTFLRGVQWRWTGAEIGWLVMAFAAGISTLVTSNRRIATNASCDWLTTILLLFVLANLCRNRLRVALVLAVITASGVTSSAKCFMQIQAEFADMRAYYNSMKEQFWQDQNIPLDDPRVQLFERRMAAEDASGFFPHSNTQGAWLSLAGFAAMGCAALAGGTRLPRVAFGALAVLLFTMILTTGSKGAIVASLVGLAFWALLARTHEKLRARWRAVLIAAWVLVLVGALSVVVIGTVRKGLPGSSLDFRWNYWQVTRQIIARHVWTGVGALNFDREYLLVKPIQFPEEIKDPHNFVLAIFAQWGLVGALGLALFCVGASIRIAWAWGQGREDRLYGIPEELVRTSMPQWVAVLIGSFLLLRAWLFRNFWMSVDGAEQGAAFFDLGTYGLIWSLCVAGILWTLGRVDGSASKRYKLAALCGVGAFVLHNTIDYATFYPGGLTPFMAMLALLLAGRQQRVPPRSPTLPRLIPTMLCVVAASLYMLLVLIPVSASSAHLSRAREALGSNDPFSEHRDPVTAERHFVAAASADPLDPTPLVELAALRATSSELPDITRALEALNKALERDKKDISLFHLMAHLLHARYKAGGSQTDLLAAVGAGRSALEMYPTSPDEHVAMADLLALAAREFGLADLAAEAVQHYRRALQLNDERPGTDEVRRWSPGRRQEVRGKIETLLLPLETAPSGDAADDDLD